MSHFNNNCGQPQAAWNLGPDDKTLVPTANTIKRRFSSLTEMYGYEKLIVDIKWWSRKLITQHAVYIVCFKPISLATFDTVLAVTIHSYTYDDFIA